MLDSKFISTAALLAPSSSHLQRTFIAPNVSGPIIHQDLSVTTLEPFPPYVEPPADILALLHAQYPSDRSWPRIRRARRSIEGIADQVRLRHYQYEVTFGLYMLTTTEKVLLNGLVLLVLGMIVYGVQAAVGLVMVEAFERMLAVDWTGTSNGLVVTVR